MGGHKRKGPAQRSKNNIKPSNSGRIAELVDKKGFQFSSFSTLNETQSQHASTSTPLPNVSTLSFDMLGPNVDPNFQVVLKKINKKDATTRYKALQELKDLCKSSSPEVLIQVLPVWARIYCILAIDVEHRVREAVQDVNRLIVNSVGRNLAPYLKQITPLWFISQYDTYAPAASLASNAFQEVFSSHKLIEVISFCQAEILSYIQESILNLTPQSLSKGDLSKEEMEAKYERIIISSLNGYALYFSKVPEEQREKFIDLHQEIIKSLKFWKFSKYKTPAIRCAWYTLLSSLCQNSPFLLKDEKKQVANSIIGGIDDNDTSVLSAVWEAALNSFTHIKDFWVHVNIEKFFLPKFCNILQHGGQGNATFIYPNILLLLHSIPKEIINDKHKFFNKIFNSFEEGMKLQIVIQSPSESDAVASSFVECIQYLIKSYRDHQEFCIALLEQHVIKVLSTYVLKSGYHYQLKSFTRSLVHMLLSWYKNEDPKDIYDILRKKFWTNVLSLSLDNVKNFAFDEDQLSVVLSNQFLLISILNSPHIQFKKNLKVSFADDAKFNESFVESSNKVNSSDKNIFEKKLESDMLDFVKDLFKGYYSLCLEGERKKSRALLLSQMKRFIELLDVRLNSFILSLDPKWSSSILMWLKDPDISMEHLLGILFSSLDFLNNDEQVQLLSKLTEGRCKECLEDAVKLASHSDNNKLTEWLQSEDMKIEICKTYEKITIEKEIITNLEIAKNFFGLNCNGEFVIGSSTVKLLLEKIEKQLSSPIEEDLKIGTEMVSTLFDKISSVKQPKHEDFVFQMLESLFINIIQGHGSIVYKTWEKGMDYIANSSVNYYNLKDHVNKISEHLTIAVSDRENQVDMKLIHYTVIRFITILSRNEEISALGMDFIEVLLFSITSSSVKESQDKIEKICLFGDFINGMYDDDDEFFFEKSEFSVIKEKWDPLLDINLLGFVKSIDFVMRLLSVVLGIDLYEDEDNGGELDPNIFPCQSLTCDLKNKYNSYIVYVVYGTVLLEKLKKYYYTTQQYFNVKDYHDPFGRMLKELVQSCDPTQQREIIKATINSDRMVSNSLRLEAKELILHFLEGTLQDETINDLTISSSALCQSSNVNLDSVIFGLNLDEIRKLRKSVKKKYGSNLNLNEKLELASKNYGKLFPNFEKNMTEDPVHFFKLTAEIAWLFETVIDTYPTSVSLALWDFVRISVTKWLNITSQTQNNHFIEYVSMTNASCKLLVTISKTLSNEESLKEICEEWREVFAADAYYSLCKTWKNITEKALIEGVNYMTFLHITQLSETISHLCDMELFHKLKPDSGDVKEWVDFTMACILTPCVPVQLTSYKILLILLPNLKKLDEGLNETSLDKISCQMFEPKLLETQTVFMTMLQDFSFGVSCSVAPFTDSYTYSLAYLLLWSVLIKLCKDGDSQQKYIYPLWIKEKDIISKFIEGVVKIMPESVIHFLEKSIRKEQDIFTTAPSYTFSNWTSEKLSHLSGWLLTELMATLPAVVRQWASEADPKQLAYVDRLVTAFISPHLASREMSAISKQQKSFDNMKVYTHPSVREVIAVYSVEESSTELVIQLANNHPLSPPKVDISKAMISSTQTRQWLKQLTIFLTHQNGSIWDGLVLWKSNLDKKFEGIDECYICFSILHNTTHQLPKLSCHTCKKKFHSYCLYKWFSTSHKSTCPICRAIF